MKPLRLSLIATACAFALGACSSSGSRSLPAPAKPANTASQSQSSDTMKQVENQLTELSQKLTQAEQQLSQSSEKTSQLADKEQQLKREIGALKDEIAQLRSHQGMSAEEMQAKLAKLDQDLSQLTQEKNALDNEVKQLKKQEADRLAEEARKAEAARLAEAAKKAEADRLAEEARKAEAARLAEEAKKAEADRLAEEARKAEADRLAEEARKAEADRLAEEARKAEADRLAEEAKKAEADRLAEEARKAEAARVAELRKAFVDQGATGEDEARLSYVSGSVLEIDNARFTEKGVAPQTTDLNELWVDGQKVTLFSREQLTAEREKFNDWQYQGSVNKTYDIVADGGKVSGKVGSLPRRHLKNDFEQLRYGYLTQENGNTQLFVQGYLTPIEQNSQSPFSYFNYVNNPSAKELLRTLPTEGRFEYEGKAFYGKAGQYQPFEVTALADLNHKKVKVDLKEGENEKFSFGGVIDRNTFAGRYQGIEMKGAFYGSKGQDIGGFFYQTQGAEKDYNGVFGASKKDCGWLECTEPSADLKAFEVK